MQRSKFAFRFRKATGAAGIVLAAAVVLAGCAATETAADPLGQLAQRFPSPGLEPGEVVRIQMEALRYNDAGDRGIEIVFRFASPENRRYTGPLPRFASMIKGPLYSPLLNPRTVEYGLPEIRGNDAWQRVSVTTTNGVRVVYLFVLSRQKSGLFAGCWMTDGVQIDTVRDVTEGMI